MNFDLEDLNPGVWFDFGDARVRIRVCTGRDLENIHKKTRKKQVEYRRGTRHEFESINEEQEFKLIYDFVIDEWENICDSKGNALECNTTNKIKLLNGSPKFNFFVSKCLEQLTTDIMQIQEETEKNS